MVEFLDLLKVLYKKKKELAALEKARSDAFSASGQQVAAKQAEVTQAEKDLMELCK